MNERDAFIRGIAANVYDDTPRLAFADWLDEHGEHDRAEFIRVQCELEPMRDQYEIPRAAELHEREDALEGGSREEFGLARLHEYGRSLNCEFRRGFPDLLRLNAKHFVEHGSELRGALPTIRRLVIHCLNGWGERLAACEALCGLPELELACWYSDDDIKALASSPHLADLQVLVLWLGRGDGTDPDLCQLAAKASAWPKLRELILLDPEGENEKGVKRLVTSVNRAAERNIGRYERGYPELFPIAPEGYIVLAGRLPDGRAAVTEIIDGYYDESAGLEHIILTFDASGQEEEEPLRVPLSDELKRLRIANQNIPDELYHRELKEAVGFVPGFIRVKGYHWDEGPRRGHYDRWAEMGARDTPEGNPERNNGHGGTIYWLVRRVQYVVGNDAWADKRGYVHST
jgi:uncharacterized protein (TIGR02996 family)